MEAKRELVLGHHFRDVILERDRVGDQQIGIFLYGEAIGAQAIDIDDKARLIVEYEDQSREALLSGEVSVRPNMN